MHACDAILIPADTHQTVKSFIEIHRRLLPTAENPGSSTGPIKDLIVSMNEDFVERKTQYAARGQATSAAFSSSTPLSTPLEHDSTWTMFAVCNVCALTAIASSETADLQRQQCARELAMSMLKHACAHVFKPGHREQVPSPYLTVLLTYIAMAVQDTPARLVFSEHIPFEDLVKLFNLIPSAAKAYFSDPSSRLFGTPLPEDWCIRGLEWSSKQLFGRGYWRSKFSDGVAYQSDEAVPMLMAQSEADALSDSYEGASMPPHAGGPANHLSRSAGSDVEGSVSHRETVALLRWRRLALTANWLSRVFPSIIIDRLEGRITLRDPANDKTTLSDSGFNGQPGLSDDVTLNDGSKELAALLQTSRMASGWTTAWSTKTANDAGSAQRVLASPGWTTLIFDTNVLLTALSVFETAATSKRWSIVIPLAGTRDVRLCSGHS